MTSKRNQKPALDWRKAGLGFCLAGLVTGGYAQESVEAPLEGKPAWTLTPSISTSLTYTDNASPGNNVGTGKGDTITNIAPGLRLQGKGGRIEGNVDFRWQQNLYANHSDFNGDQKYLTATGKAELVEQWLFMDVSSNIGQSPISAFGTQTASTQLANTNRTETRSYRWSPYIQGVLLGAANYELRYSSANSSAAAGVLSTGSGTQTDSWNGRLSGGTPLALLGWSLTTDNQRSQFGTLSDIRTTRTIGTLEYRIDPQVKLYANAGRESDNYSSFQYRSRTVSGFGIDWAPTERTKLSAKKDRHSYGNGYSVDFEHRTGLTAWKFTDSRGAMLPAFQMNQPQLSPAYYQLYALASAEPDPILRDQKVRALMTLLGIPIQTFNNNLMSYQPTVMRSQQASVTLEGANNTVTLALQRSQNERIGTGLAVNDDFALSSSIRQTGLTASWAHKLTPDSTLTFNALSSRSEGNSANQDTRLRSMSLMYTTKLGERTTANLALRQSSFDNAGGSNYDEQALTGTLTASF